jgi:DNA-binding NarL/FixJ family response regulator
VKRLKERAAEDLVQAVAEVTRGGIYLSPSISRTVVQAYLTQSELNPDPLSVRERQVLQLVAEGNTSKDVATILGISVKTAESHRNHIMDKLNIHDVAGLVRYAIRNGLIELEVNMRERQVLQLVAEGNSSKHMATILGISEKTAKSHRNHIMDKLNMHDVAGLVRYAIRNGLIELEVNMREREREQLARRDAYERELERLAKKRKQG